MEELDTAEAGGLERLEIGRKSRLRGIAADDMKPGFRTRIPVRRSG